jgi:choline dehydrogenase-like flavoprotein
MLSADPSPYAPLSPEEVATHSVDWWLTTEDLPDPDNRIRLQNGRIVMEYQENNGAAYARLEQRWIEILRSMECAESVHPHPTYFLKDSKRYFTGKLPVEGVGHQMGTCRFGEDPRASVLDLHCRTHAIDNLYVVDGSFFPSSGAVNPTLTIIANALRVGDHLRTLL